MARTPSGSRTNALKRMIAGSAETRFGPAIAASGARIVDQPTPTYVGGSFPWASRYAPAARVEATARLAVRHRGVPDDLTVEARQVGDQIRELTDRRLVTRSEVHRLLAVVPS